LLNIYPPEMNEELVALLSDCFRREVLSWFDERGDRYLTTEERAERLAARLRELGEDPEKF